MSVHQQPITVTWPQLPQRPLWVAGSSSSAPADGGGTGSTTPSASAYGLLPITDHGGDEGLTTSDGGCEYLDHTADVQLHAWGATRAASYAAAVVGLHSYMIDAPGERATHGGRLTARGHDEHSLLYALLDEALFLFASESFVVTHASVTLGEAQHEEWSASASVQGFFFVHGVHQQGTEVKAITYSNMHVVDKTDSGDGFHTYVIVDI